MAITYTPNLNLKVSSDDDAITKYNLNRIDYLAQKISIAVNGNTQLTSSTDVFIGAVYGLGVNRFNGTITLDAGNLGALDVSSKVQVNARNFTVNTDGGTITLDAGSIDLGGIALDNYLLADGSILVGDASNKAVAVPVSGDITLSNTGVMTLNIGTVGTGHLQDGSVTSPKLAAETILDANISNSASISYSKIDLLGQIVNADISGNAAIEQGKILGLVSALSGKEPSFTKGSLNLTPTTIGDISGTGRLVDSDLSINIIKASASQDGYLSKEDFQRFAAGGVVTGDFISGNSAVHIAGGANSTVDNTAIISVDTASASQAGLLSATDWSTFNGKQNTLSFTPEDISNKDSSASLGASDTKYPTQYAVKQYVDTGLGTKEPTVTKGNLTGVANRTSVSGGTGAVIGSGASVDIDSTLMPSPVIGDIGRVLMATGANASTWQAVSISDEKLKVSSSDTTAGYLNGKLTAGSGISLTVGTPSGDETLAVANTDKGSTAVGTHESTYDHSLIATAEQVANKDTSTSLGTSDTKYPSQNAVKSYVDTKTASRYTLAITAPSWTGAGPYSLAITGATHLRGNTPLISCKELVSGTSYRIVYPDEILIDSSNGNITIQSSTAFIGDILIV